MVDHVNELSKLTTYRPSLSGKVWRMYHLFSIQIRTITVMITKTSSSKKRL